MDRKRLTLEVDVAKELRYESPDGYEEVSREHWDEHRWYSIWRLVFKFEDDYYEWLYDVPSTEMQEHRELYPEYLVARQVFPTTKTVTVYK